MGKDLERFNLRAVERPFVGTAAALSSAVCNAKDTRIRELPIRIETLPG